MAQNSGNYQLHAEIENLVNTQMEVVLTYFHHLPPSARLKKLNFLIPFTFRITTEIWKRFELT